MLLHLLMPHIGHAEPSGTGSAVSIMSDSIQVAGDMLHALASHLGISELSCVSEFPSEIALARNVLTEAAEGSMLASRMQTDVAEVTGSIKSLVWSFTLQDAFLFVWLPGICILCNNAPHVSVAKMYIQNSFTEGVRPKLVVVAWSIYHG